MALGASPSDLVGLVLGGGARLAAIGIVFGLAATLLVGRALSSLLFSVSPLDPAVMASSAIAVLLGSLAACALPALRARNVDPVVALRAE
jgi:ABC-type antimicrobial peptide transport system permease subunit